MALMTERHIAVQLMMMEAIMKCRKVIEENVYQNRRINMNQYKELEDVNADPFTLMRPDLYFWANIETEQKNLEVQKLFIIELAKTFDKKHENSGNTVIKYSLV